MKINRSIVRVVTILSVLAVTVVGITYFWPKTPRDKFRTRLIADLHELYHGIKAIREKGPGLVSSDGKSLLDGKLLRQVPMTWPVGHVLSQIKNDSALLNISEADDLREALTTDQSWINKFTTEVAVRVENIRIEVELIKEQLRKSPDAYAVEMLVHGEMTTIQTIRLEKDEIVLISDMPGLDAATHLVEWRFDKILGLNVADYIKAIGKPSSAHFNELCATGTLSQVECAIKNGADVNAIIGTKMTPLMFAAQNEHGAEVAMALLKAGANVNAKDDESMTPLTWAVWLNPDTKLIEVLINAGADVKVLNWSPLFVAVATNAESSSIMTMLEPGMKIDDRDTDGRTPFMFSARNSPHPDIIARFIKIGADVNAKSNDGETPLTWAAAANANPEVILTLVKNGANINAKADNGWTPLMYAVRDNPSPEIIVTLIMLGADVNTKDTKGMTPLMIAAGGAKTDIITTLISAGADINAKDDEGSTSLRIALEMEHKEVADMLRKAGAKE